MLPGPVKPPKKPKPKPKYTFSGDIVWLDGEDEFEIGTQIFGWDHTEDEWTHIDSGTYMLEDESEFTVNVITDEEGDKSFISDIF